MGSRLGYVVRASTVMVRDPLAGLTRVRSRLDRRGDRDALARIGLSVDELYPIAPDWLERLHRALGAEWPCSCPAEAERLHEQIRERFDAEGLPPTAGGWCDGGISITSAVWAIGTHLEPEVVVETGVSRGVMSRFVLESMQRRGVGHLSSIDLPNIDSRFHSQLGIAVPDDYRDRWTVSMGSSQRVLPGLLDRLGTIDLFIHDSHHTGPTMRFEMEHAWAALRPGGALVVDDVYGNVAFHRFVEQFRPAWWCVGANPNGGYRFGIALKEGDLARELATRIADAGGSTG